MWSPNNRKNQNLKTLFYYDTLSPCQNSITCYELLPAFLSNKISEYDDTRQEIMCLVTTNMLLTSDDPSWLQATLPVKFGGLGICSAVQVATSAYLSSVAASEDFVLHRHKVAPSIDSALSHWSGKYHLISPPLGTASSHEKCWDTLTAAALAASLLDLIPK